MNILGYDIVIALATGIFDFFIMYRPDNHKGVKVLESNFTAGAPLTIYFLILSLPGTEMDIRNGRERSRERAG